MSTRSLEQQSKEELVAAFTVLQNETSQLLESCNEKDRLLHELHVHQVELEMQNRELRDAHGLIEESRSRYADLYDFAPVGYCTFDEMGKVVEVNLAGAALFGTTRDRIVGHPLVSRLRGSARTAFGGHLARCIALDARVVTELDLSTNLDHPTIVQLVTHPASDRAGGVRGFRTAVHDISALKSLENRLSFFAEAGMVLPSSLDYQTTLDAVARLPVPILADVCLVDVYGSAAGDQRKVAFGDSLDPSIRAQAARLEASLPLAGPGSPREILGEARRPVLLPAQPAERARTSEFMFSTASTALPPRAIMVVPMRVRGALLGTMTFVALGGARAYSTLDLVFAEGIAARAVIALDNAALYRTAQRAIEGRQAQLAVVSHDLRNPLNVVLVSAALMLERPVVNDRRVSDRKGAEAIQRAGTRMERLLRDLLDVASIEGHHFTVDEEAQSVAPLVHEAIEVARVTAAPKGIRVESHIGSVADLDIDCDAGRVLQVLGNLIGNAVKFSPVGSLVRVGAWVQDDLIGLSVADDGPGISAEELPRVFDRFWQTRTTANLGTGLGLSIAKGIVEAHGGTLWIESKYGEGTTFFFTLRRSTPSSPRRELGPVADAPVLPLGGTMLLVDDDPDVREALADSLRFRGFDVVTTQHGADALAYLREAKTAPAMVVLDLEMPVMDGWDFLAERAAKPELAAIPVVVMTAQSGTTDRVKHLRAACLEKPVHVDRLVRVVESLRRST